MSEARRVRRRARYAALAAAGGEGRGGRFALRRAGGETARFADLFHVPDWLMLDNGGQERVARLAGLIKYRTAIDRELSGPRLAMVAEAVGEDVFDAACAAELPRAADDVTELPRPDALVADGWNVLRSGLPPVFADMHPGARGDQDARMLTQAAMRIAATLA